MLLLGSFTFMTMAKKFGPVGKVITIAAGVAAIIMWMLKFNRATLHGIYQNPIAKPVIDLVCKLTKDQPPVDASDTAAQLPMPGGPAGGGGAPAAAAQRPPTASARSYAGGGSSGGGSVAGGSTATATSQAGAGGAAQGESNKILLKIDSDFRAAVRKLKDIIGGNDENIDQTMRQIQNNLKLREKSSVQAALPPVGIFMFIGRPGLGKRTTAVEIARLLYPGDSVGLLDLAEPGASLTSLIGAAKANPFQTFIIENINTAGQQVQNDLLAIFAGQPLIDPQTNTRVSFRHCFFFLLVHKDADNMPKPTTSGTGTGFTVVADHLVQTADLDQMLTLSLHGMCPFVLPEKDVQAQIIAHLMEQECRKYKLTLGGVNPSMLAREVEEVSKLKSFKTEPARISRLLSRPISEAVIHGGDVVELDIPSG